MPWKRTPATCAQCGRPFMAVKDGRTYKPARFCSRACMRVPGAIKPALQRFWSKVEKTDGCWLWTGARRSAQGHGGFYFGGRWTHAHRVSYAITYGSIPPKMEVCHRCDNPPCVRPDHLFLGTHRENMADMLAKYRGREQVRPDRIAAIVEGSTRGLSHRQIAAECGVGKSTVTRILQRAS